MGLVLVVVVGVGKYLHLLDVSRMDSVPPGLGWNGICARIPPHVSNRMVEVAEPVVVEIDALDATGFVVVSHRRSSPRLAKQATAALAASSQSPAGKRRRVGSPPTTSRNRFIQLNELEDGAYSEGSEGSESSEGQESQLTLEDLEIPGRVEGPTSRVRGGRGSKSNSGVYKVVEIGKVNGKGHGQGKSSGTGLLQGKGIGSGKGRHCKGN